MIRVLIVDDSAFMRMRIRTLLEADPEIRVAGIARDGWEALNKVISLNPDIVTMDISMPKMNGAEAVKKIMEKNPVPVIMVSSLNPKYASDAIQALENGAIDYISKDELNSKTLLEKIHIAARGFKGIRTIPWSTSPTLRQTQNKRGGFSIIGIGISTGGPKALVEVLPKLPKELPAGIVIAQHMPAIFTKSLAERIEAISHIKVREAKNGERIKPGHAYFCPGGMSMAIETRDIITLYPKESLKYIYAPSADLLMASIGKIYGERGLCIVMTGMGSDGFLGIQEAKKRGSYIIAQSEATSTIYGMPKVIIDQNLQDEIVDLEDLGERITELCDDSLKLD